MFLRIEKLLGEEQLATVRASLNSESAPWVDGRVTAGHQGAPVKHNQQLEEGSGMARELGNFILAQLERNALFISAVLPNKVYPPMFNRYGEGMYFGTHVDGSVRMIPGSPHKLRTDLSATLFLAEPQSYDGGELVLDSKPDSRRCAPGAAVRARRHHPTVDADGRRCGFAGAPDRALSRAAEGVDGDLNATRGGAELET